MIKTIVLDLDGPLLNGMYRHYQCYRTILTEWGYAPIGMRPYWKLKRDRIDLRQILSLSEAEPIYVEFVEFWLNKIETRRYLSLDRLQAGVTDILEEWRRAGISLLLATMRSSRLNLHWQLRNLGLAKFFDEIVTVGGAHSADKAASVGTLLASSRLEEVLWIGDTEVDIGAARKLGVRVCALACGLRSRGYLADLSPDVLETDLRSFARCGYLAAI